jgi:hypothetical protein
MAAIWQQDGTREGNNDKGDRWGMRGLYFCLNYMLKTTTTTTTQKLFHSL